MADIIKQKIKKIGFLFNLIQINFKLITQALF